MSLSILKQLCAVPTAPFCEYRAIAFVEAFAKARPALKVSRDRFGNRLLLRPGKRGTKLPRLIYVAHLDHPGFIAADRVDDRHVRAEFHGGVMATLLPTARARFFRADGSEVVAKIVSAEADDTGRASTALIATRQEIPAGTPGMFDLTPGVIRGERFHSRVCDDLAGAASALATLAALSKAPADATVGALFTRAEEQGFIGAIAAMYAKPSLLKKTDRLISIECSAEQPVAKQGAGVVLRVGDRTSIFHSAFSRFITTTAEEIGKRKKSFKYQRALMPGGTCEGTVFDAWGYVAAAACVPLGNYHNMDKVRARIDAEHVNVNDWQNMVTLFVELARKIHTFDGTHAELRERLTKRFRGFEGRLK
jgi:putative aminopeptidase FrvX